MTTLPPAPECSCSKSVCEISRCKCKAYHSDCTDLCCCGAEEDSCKTLPVTNMLVTFEQLFSCGFIAVSTSDFDL